MTSNVLIISFIIGAIVIYVVPNVILFKKFRGRLPNDIHMWGSYADFVNGMVSPILALINVSVFVYLTHQIAVMEDKNGRKSIENERKVTLSNFRYNAIIELGNRLNVNNLDAGQIRDASLISLNIKSARAFLISFVRNNEYLFPVLSSNEGKKVVTDLEKAMMDLALKLDKQNNFDLDSLKNDYWLLEDKRSTLMKMINQYTLEELTPAK